MADYKHDIDKYLRGEMTPAEMNALEKKALHDPFLADALEGAQQLSPGDFTADLNRLQSALNARIQKRGTGGVWIGRIAAGLILLALTTYIVVSISSNRSAEKGAENLALNKQEEPAAAAPSGRVPSPPADSAMAGGGKSLRPQEEASQVKKPEVRREKDQSIASPPSAEDPKAIEEHADDQRIAEAETIAKTVEPQKQIARESQADAPITSGKAIEGKKKDDALLDEEGEKLASNSSAGARAKAPSSSYTVNRKVIRGKVTFSEDGMGLPGVNVLIKGSNEGTVTDGQGIYEIPVAGAQPTLLFSFIGFTSKELIAKSDQLDVQLDADVSALSEVVVVGYGADRAVSSPAPPVMELATPEGGRKAFKQYLENNLQYPEQALKIRVEGKVTIQFSIGMTGQLTDFSVIRGIGHGCDDEVIRLIKEGPKWHPSKKNEAPIKDRVRVRMRFSLPKK